MNVNYQDNFELKSIQNFVKNIDIIDEREVQNYLEKQCIKSTDFELFSTYDTKSRLKEIYLITGGVAVGKSTIAYNFIRYFGLHGFPFISSNVFYNLEYAGKDFSIKDYNSARDIVNVQLNECLERNISFVLESVLSKKKKIKYLELCKKCGYKIHCIFVTVESYQVAISRSKTKQTNNYSIKSTFIKDRHYKSKRSLFWLFKNADSLIVIDNTITPKLTLYKFLNNILYYDSAIQLINNLLSDN